jgi:hypothetical protein
MDKPETKENEEWTRQRQRKKKNGQDRDKRKRKKSTDYTPPHSDVQFVFLLFQFQ